MGKVLANILESRRKLYVLLSIGVIFLLFAIQIQSALALPYNLNNNGISFKGYQDIDRYTEVSKQYCTFQIQKIQDVQEFNHSVYSDEMYSNGESPDEWNAGNETEGETLLYYSKVFESSSNISWNEMNSRLYSPHSLNSTKCFKLKHEAITQDSMGEGIGPSISHMIEKSTIGSLEFDIMPFLAVDIDGSNGHKSYGEFHLTLFDSRDGREGFHVMIRVENSTGGQFKAVVYVYAVNEDTGKKTELTPVFETIPDIFNWMNIKIFYDLYNDVYNITVAQYAYDFGSSWLKTPVSTIFRGLQYDEESWEISNERSIINPLECDVTYGRYAPTHLFDSFKMWIQTDENTPSGESSEVYIDNIELYDWHFPAIYADVTLTNRDISQTYPGGLSYMNDTIISCYEPPKYPGESETIGLVSSYLLNPLNPGIMTPWLYAPSWIYAIPPVLSVDHNLNVRTIETLLNDVEHPLEERGIYKPKAESLYGLDKTKHFNVQFFQYNESGSDPEIYLYRFDARYGSFYMLVKYHTDVDREGMLDYVQLYNKSMVEDYLMYDFTYQYFGQFYGEQQESEIDGYPFSFVMIFGALTVFFLIRKRMS